MTTNIKNLAMVSVSSARLREGTLRDWKRPGANAPQGQLAGAEWRPAPVGGDGDARLPRKRAKPEIKSISPRSDVNAVAAMLLRTEGAKLALKRAANERLGARRARSRRRFQFWLAVTAAIEAQLSEAQS